MKFENVLDFPQEREAYMIVRKKLNLTEEEYLKLTFIERKELAQAYRAAKELGLHHQEELKKGYPGTGMFDKNGAYNLAEAVIIVKKKAGILSIAKTKFKLKDSIKEFVLKGDKETNIIAKKVADAYVEELSSIVPHLRPLILEYASNDDGLMTLGGERKVSNRFEFE